ncbi:MAG: BON domain-containing protein [Phenylobacterium sp.]|uniref:BON domain-containing protein n=1 Tax=Phenylobacterium sp. TaxID=1871053 RepID=UPI00391D4B99
MNAAVRDAVLDALGRAGAADGVRVSIRDGIVVLDGAAATPAQAFAAPAAACRTPGVAAVVDRIGLEETGTPADLLVARAALTVLADLPTPLPVPLGLSVREGVVTLHGQVPDARARLVVEQELLQHPDVGDVRNFLHAAEPGGEPAERLRGLLQREGAAIEALTIEVDDDAVKLGGRAEGWFDRDVAERLAWTLPGVRSVANFISLPADAVVPSAAKDDDLA